MSDEVPKPTSDRATVTWRAVVLLLLGILGVMSTRILSQLDKTTDLAISTQAMVGALAQRVDAHSDRFKGVDERNASQDARMDRTDSKIEVLANRLWHALPGNMKGNP
jgi:hypothetical protein